MVDADQTFVIVGGGLAGAKAAETLRAEGFTGRVILICDERDHPYERPPLSKGYLLGKEERDSVFVHEPAWYAQQRRRTAPRPDRRRASTAPRRPSASATTAPSSTTTSCCWPPAPNRAAWTSPAPTSRACTTCAASPTPNALKGVLAALGRDNGHLVIAGAGWIGLEVAAAAREYGAEVTVVEPAATPAARACSAPNSATSSPNCTASTASASTSGPGSPRSSARTAWSSPPAPTTARSTRRTTCSPAIGAAPRTALAEAAGLELADRAHGGGIAVDEQLRTSDPDIYAAGDVASFPHALFGTRLRVEHWANALNGGPAAARAMLGKEVVYDRVPYFFSDQYDLGMEYSGWAPPGAYDEVVIRGRRREAASSSPSGSRRAGCWPG